MPQLLVFTDLDGSLLDHHDYSYEAARPALGALRRRGVPLVLVTSKTRAEVEPLARELGFDAPFATENGGGVFLPPGWARWAPPEAVPAGRYRAVILGLPYAEIRRFVAAARAGGIELRGFGDLTAGEVAELAALSPEAAVRAKEREFTEPFVLADEASLPRLEERARRAGLAVTRGGRFFHLVGAGQDKGGAVRIVQTIMQQALRSAREPGDRPHLPAAERILTVGVGDGRNDLSMLQAVDLAVVIPRPDGGRLSVPGRRVRVAPAPGSAGWNRAVLAVLEGCAAAGASAVETTTTR